MEPKRVELEETPKPTCNGCIFNINAHYMKCHKPKVFQECMEKVNNEYVDYIFVEE